MSKLRFAASWAKSASEMASMYRVEPTRPDSSAPHQAKRTRFSGLIFSFFIWMASSRLNAEPEPLSLMPGPSGTESRCEPTIVVLSGLPVVSARMLVDVRRSLSALTISWPTGLARPARRAPSANEMPAAGMSTSGSVPSWAVSPSVPATTSSRPGSLPWLKTITPDAPAAWALRTFTSKLHEPRWTSAMFPAGKPVKSAASQPEPVPLPSGVRSPSSLMSTGVIGFSPVSPLAE